MTIDAQTRELLAETVRQKHSVLLSGDALPITFQTFALQAHAGHVVLENRIRPKFINRFAASGSFTLQAGMVRFQSDKVESDGEHLIFPLKANAVIEETRQAERFSFTADERVISEILNPFDGETRLSKSVMDMSATGLSLRTTFESKLFEADTYLPSIRVLIDGELYKQGPGRVVYRRKLMDLNGHLRTQVGIKLKAELTSEASAEIKTKLKKWQRIFVNRSLNMGRVKAIGFDMDHTLVTYNREEFEALAFRETLKKFIEAGYPAELAQLTFDPDFLIRGLLVDMERGNLLKVDGHKYVKIAFHGRKKLEKDVRHRTYNSESFKAASLLSVDTFFALSEVQLFTEIVDYMERHPGQIQKTYREVYHDLRRFIDLSHADGSIKTEVLANPARFLKKDKHLAATLSQYVEAGKSLFLLTNSSWDYTNAIMSFVLDEPTDDFPDWRHYFETVIVGAGKPGFFVGSQPFYEVMTESGLLRPTSSIAPGTRAVYHGGNAVLFQKLTGFKGDEILFVGDHLYGDIIRSKHSVNWRTMLIVEELDVELPKLESLKEPLDRIKHQLMLREALDEELQILRSRVQMHVKQAEKAKLKGETKKAHYLLKDNDKLTLRAKEKETELESLDGLIKKMIEEREGHVHPVWGELMKVGLERSRFADQVSDYACIYTSNVTNLRFYSPFKRYSSSHDVLPHDL